MAPRGRARAAILAALVAITLVVPSLASRADLLGGLTDSVDETVDVVDRTVHETTLGMTEVVDEAVDGTEEVVDGTIGSTGTLLDEPVDMLTDTVDATSDVVTGTVDATTTAVGETVVTATGTVRGTVDGESSSGGEPSDEQTGRTAESVATTATTIPRTTAIAGATTPTDDVPWSSDEAPTGAVVADRSSDVGAFGGERLSVLAAVGGLSDPSVLEPVRIVAIGDESLYGRLLDWLVGAGSGLLGLLAGPILALEILLRALLSAGSGMVAPASLLVSYVIRLLWESRGRTPEPATAS